MDRINIYKMYGDDRVLDGWFDRDAVIESVEEDTVWDGGNLASAHPLPRWHHQHLLRTAGGRWVLHTWDQWQGGKSVHEYVDDQQARDWLIANHSDDVVERYWGPVEPERGPGRPRVGSPINVALGDDLLARVDAAAEQRGATRADTIRTLLSQALSTTPPPADPAGQARWLAGRMGAVAIMIQRDGEAAGELGEMEREMLRTAIAQLTAALAED